MRALRRYTLLQSRSISASPEGGIRLKTLLIVHHSVTGGTRQMAQAAFDAASVEPGVHACLLHARDAAAQDVIEADGYIFATPENLGSMSGMLKDFFDRTYYPVLDRVNGRPYASMICAGSDGQGAARQIERIALGWRLKAIAPALIVMTHAQSPEAILAEKHLGHADLQRCRDLAGALAGGLALSIF